MSSHSKFFNLANEGMAVVRGDHFGEVNEAWSLLSGYRERELLDHPWRLVFSPEEWDSALVAREECQGDGFVHTYSGMTKYVRWRTHPSAHTQEVYLVVMDVTDIRRAESELGKYALKLRDRAEALQRSNQDLEQFAYAASHDLQTPLRKIRNFVLLLAEEYGGMLTAPEAQTYMKHIVNGAETSQKLIDGLLAFSRAGDHLEPVLCGLNLPAERAIDLLTEEIYQSGARIHVGALPAVTADERLMTNVFQNLLSNAIKFAKEGEPPRVTISAEETPQHVEITVQDNGIGFDPKKSKRIFGLFQRLSTSVEGSGIGLTLCKRIVERHGGSIEAESVPGIGTGVRFTLPKDLPSDTSTIPPAPSSSPHPPR